MENENNEIQEMPAVPEEEPVPAVLSPEEQKKALRKDVCKFYNRTAAAGLIHFAALQTVASIVQVIYAAVYLAQGGDKEEVTAYLTSVFVLLVVNAVAYTAAHPVGMICGFAMTGTVKGSSKMLSKPQISALATVIGIPALFSLQTAVSLLQYAFTAITGSSGMENMNTAMLRLGDDAVMNIVLIAYVVIIGPIGEEIFFRGMALKGLGCIDVRFGIIMSSVMFGFFHGNIMQFFTGVLIGLFLSYVDVKANSIIPSVILHVANNFIALMRYFISDKYSDIFTENVDMAVTIALTAVGAVCLVIVIKMLRKQEAAQGYFTPKFSYPDGDRKGYGMKLAVKSPCMWVFTAIYTAFILFNIFGGPAA